MAFAQAPSWCVCACVWGRVPTSPRSTASDSSSMRCLDTRRPQWMGWFWQVTTRTRASACLPIHAKVQELASTQAAAVPAATVSGAKRADIRGAGTTTKKARRACPRQRSSASITAVSGHHPIRAAHSSSPPVQAQTAQTTARARPRTRLRITIIRRQTQQTRRRLRLRGPTPSLPAGAPT